MKINRKNLAYILGTVISGNMLLHVVPTLYYTRHVNELLNPHSKTFEELNRQEERDIIKGIYCFAGAIIPGADVALMARSKIIHGTIYPLIRKDSNIQESSSDSK